MECTLENVVNRADCAGMEVWWAKVGKAGFLSGESVLNMGGLGAVMGTNPSFCSEADSCDANPSVGDGLCVLDEGSNGVSIIGWSGSGEG